MRVCIFDDEQVAIDFLTHQLTNLKDVQIVFSSSSPYLDPYDALLSKIDVVFLDIEMPEKSGLSLAEQINERYPHIHIVFVSAHRGYAIEAFELNALDYLLKPVKISRLEKTVNKIKQHLEKEDDIHPSKEQLNINVFGELSFSLDEKEITHNLQWRTSKSKEVFLFLLHNQDKITSKSLIVETIWPNIDPEKGFANLYVSIYNMRKTLQHLNHFISIANIDEGYLLRLNQTKVDKNIWYIFFEKTLHPNQENYTDYQEHLDLYKGLYLEELDYVWAEPLRFHYDEIWVHHAKKLAEFYLSIKDTEQALRLYLAISKKRPDDDHVAFQIMKVYDRLNYRMLVEHQYKSLKNQLEAINVQIDPVIENWFAEWKNNIHSTNER